MDIRVKLTKNHIWLIIKKFRSLLYYYIIRLLYYIGGFCYTLCTRGYTLFTLENVCASRRGRFVNFQLQLWSSKRYGHHVYAPYLLKFAVKFGTTRDSQKTRRREKETEKVAAGRQGKGREKNAITTLCEEFAGKW